MTGLGEVLVNQVAAMAGVEAAERSIDRNGEVAVADAGQCPQEGDCQELFFSGREAMFGDGLTCSVVKGEAEALLIHDDAVDEVGFMQQAAEVVGDTGFQIVEFLQGEARPKSLQSLLGTAGRFEKIVVILLLDVLVGISLQIGFGRFNRLS